MKWFHEAKPPTVPDVRARQIDHTLQRVRQAAMKAELEDEGARTTLAKFSPAGQSVLAALLAGANEPTGYHYHLVALSFNALLNAVRAGNREAADAAAAAVASAAVRMVGAWQFGSVGGGAGDSGGSAA